jgi:hypothetical protein
MRRFESQLLPVKRFSAIMAHMTEKKPITTPPTSEQVLPAQKSAAFAPQPAQSKDALKWH